MNRILLSCVVLFVMLAVAPAANAQLTTLYNTIEGPQTVQGINSVAVGPSFLGEFRAATSFVPTRSGNASVLSMRGQCVIPYPQGTTCQGIGEVSIQRDVNGRPSGVSLGTMGFYLTDSLSNGNPVKRECGRLSPAVPLTAGTKYWAVMTAPDGIGWNNWTDDSVRGAREHRRRRVDRRRPTRSGSRCASTPASTSASPTPRSCPRQARRSATSTCARAGSRSTRSRSRTSGSPR